jgi:hypothetical protein
MELSEAEEFRKIVNQHCRDCTYLDIKRFPKHKKEWFRCRNTKHCPIYDKKWRLGKVWQSIPLVFIIENDTLAIFKDATMRSERLYPKDL